MILIIEGPDGAGKTTLAEKLAKQTGYMLMHRSKPESEEDKKRMLDQYLQAIEEGQDCIFDRAWYSEMVYGPIMRDASVITYPQMYVLEKYLMKHGAIVIYCRGDKNNLWERCTQRGEEYITDFRTFSRIYEAYESLMLDDPHLVPVVTYEYKDM